MLDQQNGALYYDSMPSNFNYIPESNVFDNTPKNKSQRFYQGDPSETKTSIGTDIIE